MTADTVLTACCIIQPIIGLIGLVWASPLFIAEARELYSKVTAK